MRLLVFQRWSGRVTNSIARARFNGLPESSRPAVLRLVERRAKWSEPQTCNLPVEPSLRPHYLSFKVGSPIKIHVLRISELLVASFARTTISPIVLWRAFSLNSKP